MTLRALSLLLGGALALATTAFVLLRFLKRGGARPDESDPEIRNLVADLVAETLSSKLSRSRLEIVEVLTGRRNDTELRRKIEAALRSVNLIFERRGKARTGAEMKIEVCYEDGGSKAAVLDRSWDELPDRAREAFLRTGQQVVTLPWRMPWAAGA
jgi:hypothetical protein